MLKVKFVYVVLSGAPELKNFMDPLEVVKKHRVPKIGVFCPLFCLGMLGYSTGTQPLSSVAIFELNRTIWQYFIAFL